MTSIANVVAAFLWAELPKEPVVLAGGTLAESLGELVDVIERERPAARARRLADTFPGMDCVLTADGIVFL